MALSLACDDILQNRGRLSVLSDDDRTLSLFGPRDELRRLTLERRDRFDVFGGIRARPKRRYTEGSINYTVAWVLLGFLGVFGLHRLYMGKYWTAILYFLTGGLFLIGVLYDFWNLNEQVQEANMSRG